MRGTVELTRGEVVAQVHAELHVCARTDPHAHKNADTARRKKVLNGRDNARVQCRRRFGSAEDATKGSREGIRAGRWTGAGSVRTQREYGGERTLGPVGRDEMRGVDGAQSRPLAGVSAFDEWGREGQPRLQARWRGGDFDAAFGAFSGGERANEAGFTSQIRRDYEEGQIQWEDGQSRSKGLKDRVQGCGAQTRYNMLPTKVSEALGQVQGDGNTNQNETARFSD
ncbi:hypothetical protein C8J57DRAFT_1484851 [Mycena rebaudengoi]|nr:hypothetical protein C8J57DRAFT_1484851 [Mycena rebaudengoi]